RRANLHRDSSFFTPGRWCDVTSQAVRQLGGSVGDAVRGLSITARPWGREWPDAQPAARSRVPAAYPLKLLLVVAGYYAAAHLVVAFQFTGPIASLIWLPVCVRIAALHWLGLGV